MDKAKKDAAEKNVGTDASHAAERRASAATAALLRSEPLTSYPSLSPFSRREKRRAPKDPPFPVGRANL